MKKLIAIVLSLVLLLGSISIISITAIAATADSASPKFNNSNTFLVTGIKENELEDMISCPQILSVECVADGVKVTWTKITGAAKYALYCFNRETNKWSKVSDTTNTFLIHTPEKSNVVYDYTVRAIDKNGIECVGYSTVSSSVLYYAVPILKSATASKNGINIVWEPVDGVKNYRVFYKVGKDGEWVQLIDTKNCEYLFKEVKKDIEYTFSVRCLNDDSSDYLSAFDEKGITTEYVSMPVINSCVPAASGVEISWKPIEGAEKYRVLYKCGKGWKTIGDTNTTSIIHKGLKNEQTYTYTVRALSKDGSSYISDFDQKGYEYKYYSIPKLKGVNDTLQGPLVAWEQVPGVSKYQVFYKVDDEKKWQTEAGMIVSGTTYTYALAKTGHKYTFTVKCVNNENKFISYHDIKGVSALYLDAPKLSVTTEYDEILVKWEEVDGADSYMVFVKNGGDDEYKALEETRETSYTYTPDAYQYTYQFVVRCLDEKGNFASGYNNAQVATTYLAFASGVQSDINYTTQCVTLSDHDRDMAERICMGEASVLGFEGMALVAQCVRDTMLKEGYTTVERVLKEYGYDGSTAVPGNEEAKAAVRYIFDEGGAAVQHRILVFYASDICKSAFHESQNYICSCGSVRFFDFWD